MEKMKPAEIWTVIQTREGSAVLLRPRDTDIAVPVLIGQLESQSILIGNEGIVLPRPLTHDLFLNVLLSVNLFLERVEICKLVENTFHAQLVITGGKYTVENPLILDSRPSDAFALAVRRKCPILVSGEIVEQTGIPLDMIIETPENIESYFPSGQTAPPKNENAIRLKIIRIFQEQLNEAVAKEDYEQAAEIRDILKEMEGSDNEI